ncbi:MAG: preprotein translocase subunit YajC [Parvularculales bacterium]
MLITPAYAQTASAGEGDFLITLLPFVAVFAIIYFLIIRPQQKRVKEHRAMVDSVRRGDTVVTAGGLIGKIHKVMEDNECIVEVADNVRLRVVKSTLSDVRARTETASSDGKSD